MNQRKHSPFRTIVILVMLTITLSFIGLRTIAQKMVASDDLIQSMKQTIQAQEKLLDAYRRNHIAVGEMVGIAADALDAVIHGPYSREEMQAKIREIADILRDVNHTLTPEEAEDMSTHIVRQYIAGGVDPMLVTAMAITESSCRPDARGSSGEYGLLQIMPSTGQFIAREMGYSEYDPEQLLDVQTNVQYAVYYLKTRPGDIWSKVSAYNAGKAWRNPMEHWYVQRVSRAYNRFSVQVIK